MKPQIVKFRHYIETWNSEVEITVFAKIINHDFSETASCEIISIRNDSGDQLTIEEVRKLDKDIEKDLVEYAFEAFKDFIEGLDEEDTKLFGTAV